MLLSFGFPSFSAEAQRQYGITLPGALPDRGLHDALVVAVAHDEFKRLSIASPRRLANGRAVIHDIKGMYGKDEVAGRL